MPLQAAKRVIPVVRCDAVRVPTVGRWVALPRRKQSLRSLLGLSITGSDLGSTVLKAPVVITNLSIKVH